MPSVTLQSGLRLAFCGGGSGGHLFPALAVIEEIARDFGDQLEVEFFTAGAEIESRVLGPRIRTCEIATPHSRQFFTRPLRSFIAISHSISIAREELDRLCPHVVIGCGGFASVSGILAAAWRRIPIVLLEQNIVPGRATSWLARWASMVCTSFDETASLLRHRSLVCTGNPVRPQLVEANQLFPGDQGNSRPGSILVLGGSQGASALNQALLQLSTEQRGLFAGRQLVHQTGLRDAERLAKHYAEIGVDARVAPFFDEMAQLYSEADLVISRAGATTLAECALFGKPCLLVPFPGSIRDHQLLNARHFAEQGAALVCEQGSDLVQSLAKGLQTWLVDNSSRQSAATAMHSLARPDAARNVADEILKLA